MNHLLRGEDYDKQDNQQATLTEQNADNFTKCQQPIEDWSSLVAIKSKYNMVLAQIIRSSHRLLLTAVHTSLKSYFDEQNVRYDKRI